MEKFVYKTPQELGQAAAAQAAKLIRATIENKGQANIILATGTSQFETLKALTETSGIDWSKVTMFHLDEYIGIDITHPASFRKYLKERFIEKTENLNAAYLINANDSVAECERLGRIISGNPIDVALVGIGENGHLAFNDPPADFETEKPYIIVDLDEKCRMQQLGEGWFETLQHVPKQAISMGIRQIMSSEHIIVSVPDRRKAQAVKDTLEGKITNICPASILQNHPSCKIFLDEPAASLLS